MVQGIDLIHIEVVFLTYNPKRNVNKPLVKLDSTCIAGLNDLIKHKIIKDNEKYIMGIDAYNHFKWYNLMLRIELNKLKENSKLKIVHWNIESGNSEAFKMDQVIYKAVSMIIGPSQEHYYGANIGKNSKNICGSRLRINTLDNTIIKIPKTITVGRQFNNTTVKYVKHNNSIYKKCTIDYCANNCINCKKYICPFINERKKTKCACHIEKNFKMIIEESEEEIEHDRKCDNDFNIIKTNNLLPIIEIEE